MNEVKQALEEIKQVMAKQLPAEVVEAFNYSIEDLKSQDELKSVVEVGDLFPDACLLTVEGERIDLKELYGSSKLIVSFVRGNWCPFCSVEVLFLAKNYAEIKQKGGEVVVITPQKSSFNAAWSTEASFPFRVLQDKDNALSNLLGISFALQENVIPYYKALGIDLTLINGNEAYKLPIPVTYIVNEKGIVVYKYEDKDYMNRVEVTELLIKI